ncbi:LysR substrate-binding domain-containing protein [Sorangium sp. So ce1024]|uniref:LysR substrate-binding domain-containing protein n=1 Tax=unclassified Sorangium TaxID=2621164 RepID=UPI003F0943AA
MTPALRWTGPIPPDLPRGGSLAGAVPASCLADHERVAFLPSARRGQWPLDHADAVCNAMATGRIATDSFQLIRSVLRAGGGIGPLPRLLAAPDLASGRLVHVLPEWSQRAGTLYLVYPSARHVPRNVAVFRDFVIAWMKRLA